VFNKQNYLLFWLFNCAVLEDDRLLGYGVVYSRRNRPTFEIEILRTSETSVYFGESTRHHIPEDCLLHTRGSRDLFVSGFDLMTRTMEL
jgi:hypothetical protein